MIKEAIESGKALKKFRELIIQQHGNPEIINDYSLLPHCAVKKELKAENSGYIHSFNTDKIGMASVQTGAGRKEKDDLIDLGAGIIMKARIGDYINRGDTIAEIFSSSEEKCEASAAILKESVTLSKSQPEPDKLILDII